MTKTGRMQRSKFPCPTCGKSFLGMGGHVRKCYSTPAARFWAKVDKNGPGGCWLYMGYRKRHDYGWLHTEHGLMTEGCARSGAAPRDSPCLQPEERLVILNASTEGVQKALDTVAQSCILAMGVNEGETEGKPTRHPAGEGVANTARSLRRTRPACLLASSRCPKGIAKRNWDRDFIRLERATSGLTNRLAGYSHRTYETRSFTSRLTPPHLAPVRGLRQAVLGDRQGGLLLQRLQAEGQIQEGA